MSKNLEANRYTLILGGMNTNSGLVNISSRSKEALGREKN